MCAGCVLRPRSHRCGDTSLTCMSTAAADPVTCTRRSATPPMRHGVPGRIPLAAHGRSEKLAPAELAPRTPPRFLLLSIVRPTKLDSTACGDTHPVTAARLSSVGNMRGFSLGLFSLVPPPCLCIYHRYQAMTRCTGGQRCSFGAGPDARGSSLMPYASHKHLSRALRSSERLSGPTWIWPTPTAAACLSFHWSRPAGEFACRRRAARRSAGVRDGGRLALVWGAEPWAGRGGLQIR